MIIPPSLRKGDKVAITCPAKKLPHDIPDAIRLLESWGLEVVLGKTVTASWNQFAGTDELRAADLQEFLDDASIKAIFAARGGYGTIRIIDRLNFSEFSKNPKWLVGFSDITVLHSHFHAVLNTASIHGQMPLTIPDATKSSLESLRKALFGETLTYEYQSSFPGRNGETTGILIGGNLTLQLMMGGSVSEIDFENKILFIEDVGEYLYAIDRMMRHLDRAGKLTKLKGLVIGSFSLLKDNDVPFGQTAEEIIWDVVKKYDYPVCFDFPAGHTDDNHALILGKMLKLTIEEGHVKFIFQ